jgi:hypothetical protein
VLGQRGQRVDPDQQGAARLRGRGLALFQLLEHVGQLLAQEDRDNRRRRLVGVQAVVVAAGGHGHAEQVAVLVHGADHRRAEHQELGVFVRALARLEQVAQVAAQRPIDVLARAVDAGKRLFVQQADHAVLLRDARQGLHDHLLMIGRQVGVFIDGRDLVLRRGHFVVPRLHGHAQLEELALGLQRIARSMALPQRSSGR